MILLSNTLIKKIDRLRFYNKINTRIRFIFVSLICCSIWYTIQNNIFEKYSGVILALLLTTFIINVTSDLLKSETENILDAVEYDKSKINYNSLDTRF